MDKVSNRQIFFMLFLAAAGSSAIVSLPAAAGAAAGTGAWFAILTTGIMFLVPGLVWVSLNSRFPGMVMNEYSRLIAGKTAAKIISVVYALYFLLVLSLMLRSAAEIVKIEFMPDTPIWASVLALAVVSAWAGNRRVSALARTLEITGTGVLLVLALIYGAVLANGDGLGMMPLFEAGRLPDYLKGSLRVTSSFFGLSLLSVIPFSQPGKSRTKWTVGAALLAVAAVYILVTEGVFSVLGPEDALNYQFPGILAVHELTVSFSQVLRKFDVFFILGWVVAVIAAGTIIKYAADTHVRGALQVKPGFWKALATGGLVFVLAMAPENLSVTAKYYNWLLLGPGAVCVLAIPAVLLIVAKIKQLRIDSGQLTMKNSPNGEIK